MKQRCPSYLLLFLLFALSSNAFGAVFAIKAGKVYIGDGRVVEQGIVLVQDGRIRSVGVKVRIPADATVIELTDGALTPGLIDANARIGLRDLIAPGPGHLDYIEDEHDAESEDAHTPDRHDELCAEEDLFPAAVGVPSQEVVNEQSSEVVPHIRVLDGLDLRSGDFDRLVRGGVTTVYASPDASAVIGARGAVLHTAGPRHGRVLAPVGAVKATIGAEPSMVGSYNSSPSRGRATMYTRRPNSRMGLVWVFRKAFYDAQRMRDGLPVYGADAAEPQALAVVLDMLDGNTPLRIQARIQQDILSAIRLADEFQLRFTLEEATEAYRCLDEIHKAGVPVIFGPIYERASGIRASTGEGDRSRLYTFAALLEHRIPTALSAQELRDEDGLARQAMYALRFGVPLDDALRAVTATPAKMLGLEDDLGTIKRGKRADLVLWSGKPLAAESKPMMVWIDGEVAFDGR